RKVGMRNAVMPAECVLVEKNPSVAHAQRSCGKVRRQHAPAAQGAGGRPAVKAGEFEAEGAQSRSAARVNDQQVLEESPEQAGNANSEPQNLYERRTNRCD